MTHATHLQWDDIDLETPMPLIDRRRVIGVHMMLAKLTLHPGFSVGVHEHINEQIVICLEGEATFTLVEGGAEREVTVRAGEVLSIPPSVPHAARTEKGAVLIDCFSPVTEKTGIDR